MTSLKKGAQKQFVAAQGRYVETGEEEPQTVERIQFKKTGLSVGKIAVNTKEMDELAQQFMRSDWAAGKLHDKPKEVETGIFSFNQLEQEQEAEKEAKKKVAAWGRSANAQSDSRQQPVQQKVPQQQTPQQPNPNTPPNNPPQTVAERFGGGPIGFGRGLRKEQPEVKKKFGNAAARFGGVKKSALNDENLPVGGGFTAMAVTNTGTVTKQKVIADVMKGVAQIAQENEMNDQFDSSSSMDEIEMEKLGLGQTETNESESSSDENLGPTIHYSKRFGAILPDGTAVKLDEEEDKREKVAARTMRRSRYKGAVSVNRMNDIREFEEAENEGTVKRRADFIDHKKRLVGPAAQAAENEANKKREEQQAKILALRAAQEEIDQLKRMKREGRIPTQWEEVTDRKPEERRPANLMKWLSSSQQKNYLEQQKKESQAMESSASSKHSKSSRAAAAATTTTVQGNALVVDEDFYENISAIVQKAIENLYGTEPTRGGYPYIMKEKEFDEDKLLKLKERPEYVRPTVVDREKVARLPERSQDPPGTFLYEDDLDTEVVQAVGNDFAVASNHEEEEMFIEEEEFVVIEEEEILEEPDKAQPNAQ